MTDFDIEGYLRSKGLAVKPAGDANLHIACPFCDEDETKRGRLYIRTDSDPPGLFLCHLCGRKGAINALRKHYGDPILKDDDSSSESEEGRIQRQIWQEAAEYYHQLLVDHPHALKFLKDERGLTIDTIEKHQLGWADGTLGVQLRKKKYSLEMMKATGLIDAAGNDFLRHVITIPYHVYETVTQIRGKQIGGKYFTPPGQKARLYNSDTTWGSEEVIVSEGELDALVLEQIGYRAVGVPGAASWQESWNGYFSEARRVFVVFDNDAAGLAGAEKVVKAVGGKARIVHMPETGPDGAKNDPSEWIINKGHSKADFQQLLVSARGGLLLTVQDAYEEWHELQNTEGLKLGVGMLDAKLKPGLLPSQLMVILAKTGSGKTLMLLNLFHRMFMQNNDLKILFISLEQTRGDWFERAFRIYNFYNLEAKKHEALDWYRDRFYLVDKNRITEDELVNCIEEFEWETGSKPDLVAVDYLGYWARSYEGQAYERTSAAVMALKAIAKDYRVPIISPHQVSRQVRFGEEMEADAARDAGVVEETADFILGLWSKDTRKGMTVEETTGGLELKLLKSRHGGSGTTIHWQFAPLSLAMVPVGDHPFDERARSEHEMSKRQVDFDTAIYRHATGDTRYPVPVSDILHWRESLG